MPKDKEDKEKERSSSRKSGKRKSRSRSRSRSRRSRSRSRSKEKEKASRRSRDKAKQPDKDKDKEKDKAAKPSRERSSSRPPVQTVQAQRPIPPNHQQSTHTTATATVSVPHSASQASHSASNAQPSIPPASKGALLPTPPGGNTSSATPDFSTEQSRIAERTFQHAEAALLDTMPSMRSRSYEDRMSAAHASAAQKRVACLSVTPQLVGLQTARACSHLLGRPMPNAGGDDEDPASSNSFAAIAQTNPMYGAISNAGTLWREAANRSESITHNDKQQPSNSKVKSILMEYA